MAVCSDSVVRGGTQKSDVQHCHTAALESALQIVRRGHSLTFHCSCVLGKVVGAVTADAEPGPGESSAGRACHSLPALCC